MQSKQKKLRCIIVIIMMMMSITGCNEDVSSSENSSDNITSGGSYYAGYAVVDTGQTACYNDISETFCPGVKEAFYGQDAQHIGNQPDYTDNDDGSVTDNITGLMWQQGFAYKKLTCTEARAYAKTLNTYKYCDYNDWRLPTIKQLYSLIDFRGTAPRPDDTSTTGPVPFINTDFFDFTYGNTSTDDRVIDSQWVTSMLYTADNRTVFGVDFANGQIKGYDMTNPDSEQGEKTFSVRLCRGNSKYGINSFINNNDGTVTDNATGLMWDRSDSGYGINWEDALAWTDQMNTEDYLGYNDWRLPNTKELQSIVDYTRSPDTTGSAAIDPIFNISEIINMAGETDYPYFWTGTTHVTSDAFGDGAVYVAFGRGLGEIDNEIVDIHGAGCQRSDPKDGDRDMYPTSGYRPHGNVQRVFNYVRLVRDETN